MNPIMLITIFILLAVVIYAVNVYLGAGHRDWKQVDKSDVVRYWHWYN